MDTVVSEDPSTDTFTRFPLRVEVSRRRSRRRERTGSRDCPRCGPDRVPRGEERES